MLCGPRSTIPCAKRQRRKSLLESVPLIAFMVKDSLAVIAPAETAIGRKMATARRLVHTPLFERRRALMDDWEACLAGNTDERTRH